MNKDMILYIQSCLDIMERVAEDNLTQCRKELTNLTEAKNEYQHMLIMGTIPPQLYGVLEELNKKIHFASAEYYNLFEEYDNAHKHASDFRRMYDPMNM